MKTDELIGMLSTNLEAVDRKKVPRGLGAAVSAAMLVVVAISGLALGVRPDITDPGALAYMLIKLAFAFTVVLFAAGVLIVLARPGGERRANPGLAAVPFIGIMLLGAISLAFAPASHWAAMIAGDMWLECLLSIPLIAVGPFAVITWTVRQVAAPTDLVRTGAFVGLVSGGVSAMGYALHCTGDSLPFVAVWYGGTIALCTLAGARLGPRLLRW